MKRTAVLSVAVGLALACTTAVAKPPPPKPQPPPPLINLEIEAPSYNPNKDPARPLQFSAGWPIVFKMTANQSLGIALNIEPPEFPLENVTGYVIVSDQDGCLDLPPPFVQGVPCQSSDDVYLEFTPDVDRAGMQDEFIGGNPSGNPGRRLALADLAQSASPVFTAYGAAPTRVGPRTGDQVDDGYGFGADDDLPGLVVLSANGNGLVLDADFNRPADGALRNLAGFLNWVSYELRAANGKTTVHAGMNVTQNLIAPLVLADDCVGTFADPNSAFCDSLPRYRLNGSPLVLEAPANSELIQNVYPPLANAISYRIRAFVVSGVAPSELGDEDGDGDVDAADATAAGYTVISDEESVTVRRYVAGTCAGEANYFFGDIDGNGRSSTFAVCPPGPGQIRQVPN
jgi:hypothetical protein